MKTKPSLLICICIFVVPFFSFGAADNGEKVLRRFALVIGSNDGGGDRVKLRYATRDAVSFIRVMEDLGALEEKDLVVLLDPRAQDIRKGFRTLGEKVEEASKHPGRREAVIYYSGHSDEEGLLLGGEKLSYPDIRSMISALDVNVRVAILDSCSSGAFTRTKGVIKRPAFLVDSSSETKGYAFLTSSAEDEIAQESDKIEGSFFTHYLVSGLRGAADSTNDGLVTLNEAYGYAFRETLARTEKTQYGAQHPKYDIQLTGTGELVLTDLRTTSCGLVINEELEGKFFVRDSLGNLIAEINKLPGNPVELGIEPGSYEITAEMKGKYYRTTIVLSEKKYVTVSKDTLKKAESEPTAARGDIASNETSADDEGETIPYSVFHFSLFPSLPSFMAPGRHTVSVSLFIDQAIGIHGVQLSPIGNFVTEDISGLQASGVFNVTGKNVYGAQVAGVIDMANDISGAQLSGIANLASGRVGYLQGAGIINICQGLVGLQVAGVGNSLSSGGYGVQLAGVWNKSDAMNGAQISGIVNSATSFRGIQLGLVNIGGRASGVQFGLINIAETYEGGIPFGLINLIADGVLSFDTWYDNMGYIHGDIKSGSKSFYSILRCAYVPGSEPALWSYGAGFGYNLPLDPFYLNIDATINVMNLGTTWWSAYDYLPLLPELSLTCGYALGRLGVFVGASVGFDVPGLYKESEPSFSYSIPLSGSGESLTLVPHFFAGIRF